MTTTLIETLAQFSTGLRMERLPERVIEECKRDVLDTLGCAMAAIDHPKGKMGIEAARRMAGTQGSATLIGTGERSTPHGAAFANGELANALDADSVLLPGHVSPYVLPGAFATAEAQHRSGSELILSVATSHEMACRFGLAMSGYRDTQNGQADQDSIVGYNSTVFGATASAARLRGLSSERMAHALGIAAATTPVNSQRAWFMHAPTATIKYQLAGALTNVALTAVDLADLGHRGDLLMLDDERHGYPRFSGTARWNGAALTEGLGEDWRFPHYQMFKPYPHCRVMHAPLDLLIDLVHRHDLRVDEIESIQVYGEGWAYSMPCFTFPEIERVQDAQFCFAHGLAVAAHRIPPGPIWQHPDTVYKPSILALKDKVRLHTHPDYFEAISKNIKVRPTRVEIMARHQVFAAEKMYPKGTPTQDPDTYMQTTELVGKFRLFVDGLMPARHIDQVIDQVLHLEQVSDFADVMRLMVRKI